MATTQTVKCYTISLCVDQYVARIFRICIFAFGPCLSKVDLILECDPTKRTDLRDTTCVMNSKQAPVGHYTLGWKTNFYGQVVFAVTRCPDCPIMDTHGHTNIIKNVSVWGFIFSTCPSFVIFDSSEIMATIKQSTSAFNTNRNYVVSPSYNLVNNLVSL